MSVFNIIHNKCPSYLSSKLQLSQSSRNICIIIPRHKYTFRANSYFVYGAQIWNSLPLDLKRITNPGQFRSNCFNHFANM